jgi:hypothetical protein
VRRLLPADTENAHGRVPTLTRPAIPGSPPPTFRRRSHLQKFEHCPATYPREIPAWRCRCGFFWGSDGGLTALGLDVPATRAQREPVRDRHAGRRPRRDLLSQGALRLGVEDARQQDFGFAHRADADFRRRQLRLPREGAAHRLDDVSTWVHGHGNLASQPVGLEARWRPAPHRVASNRPALTEARSPTRPYSRP